jgi:hypothetical protein
MLCCKNIYENPTCKPLFLKKDVKNDLSHCGTIYFSFMRGKKSQAIDEGA